MPHQSMSSDISNAVVGVVLDHTGRGPTKARTTIARDLIVVTLRDCLSHSERLLASHGQQDAVLAMRRAFQAEMAPDLIGVVEKITGRVVEAFLSDSLHEPDMAVEVFVLVASPRA